jgi:preprotein translocase subunit SecG
LEDEKLKIALTIIFVLVAIALTIIVLSQEGKDQGFGSALTGTVDTYWSKNKKHSKEAVIKRVTAVLGVLFIVLAAVLGSKWFR